MVIIIAQIIGLAAVALFLLSYQQKERKDIILMNTVSRCLYILQYILLGAFSGAVLDVLGAVSSAVAGKKHTEFVKKHTKLIIIILNFSIVFVGGVIAVINRSLLDVFPIIGVLLHTSAFWITDEKIIRRVSLLGSPFWFVYNFLSRAYGSSLGDLFTMVSIIVAMIRYRDFSFKKKGE